MTIEVASVDSIILYFDDHITHENSLIVQHNYKILKDQNNPALIEIVPSYNSIFITYDIFRYDFNSISKYINKLLHNATAHQTSPKEITYIDVYYGLDVGFDLQKIATRSQISIEEVIALHCDRVYDVYAIGFLPGFAYMAKVDEKIATPRLETPRKMTPKGSVAIADEQTAIYPSQSPGGWNIVGKTTFELFDKNLEELSPLSIESRVKFKSISKEEFLNQGGIL
ncbi:MAG: 5-oxoprolinase subunit PxpB [Campylobacterota bacterium]|nr:5-oxoprolinase subunit PxpB [Campylobacterota bacterium]